MLMTPTQFRHTGGGMGSFMDDARGKLAEWGMELTPETFKWVAYGVGALFLWSIFRKGR